MAERSKAPDSRALLFTSIEWAFWSTNVGVGSNPTTATMVITTAWPQADHVWEAEFRLVTSYLDSDEDDDKLHEWRLILGSRGDDESIWRCSTNPGSYLHISTYRAGLDEIWLTSNEENCRRGLPKYMWHFIHLFLWFENSIMTDVCIKMCAGAKLPQSPSVPPCIGVAPCYGVLPAIVTVWSNSANSFT